MSDCSELHTICACTSETIRSMEDRIATLTVALIAIRAEVEPVKTRRVRRNGSIKAIVDAALEGE